MTILLLLNGPPKSGKDHSARIARDFYAARGLNCVIDSISNEVKRMVHRVYGLPEDPYYFENRKDLPAAEFGGITPRQAYINFSEKIIKPIHGDAYFGVRLLERLKGPDYAGYDVVILPGVGFADEVLPIVQHYGPKASLLMRMHAEGSSYDGDSRSYLDLEEFGVASHDVVNYRDSRINSDIPALLADFLPAGKAYAGDQADRRGESVSAAP